MNENDRPDFYARLDSMFEVVGKPRPLIDAKAVWWDKLSLFSRRDVDQALVWFVATQDREPTPQAIGAMAMAISVNRQKMI